MPAIPHLRHHNERQTKSRVAQRPVHEWGDKGFSWLRADNSKLSPESIRRAFPGNAVALGKNWLSRYDKVSWRPFLIYYSAHAIINS